MVSTRVQEENTEREWRNQLIGEVTAERKQKMPNNVTVVTSYNITRNELVKFLNQIKSDNETIKKGILMFKKTYPSNINALKIADKLKELRSQISKGHTFYDILDKMISNTTKNEMELSQIIELIESLKK
jgi:hypothetical protein